MLNHRLAIVVPFVFGLTAGCAPATVETRPAVTTQAPAAAGPTTTSAAPKASLYVRLGEKPAITAVVDEFVKRVAGDKRINARFINTDITRLRGMLVDFVCSATGGPCQYTGRDMYGAHAGMQLIDEEFNALVEDLVAALVTFKVPQAEQNEVLGALGPLKGDMVHAPPPEAAAHDPALVETATAKVKSLRAAGQGQAADLLAAAVNARVHGQRNYAEQVFSAVERLLPPEGLPALDPLFREGAPPRVKTALKTLPKDTAPQPKTGLGGSDEDEPEAKAKRGSLSGELQLGGKALAGSFGVVALEPWNGKYAVRAPKQRVIEQRDRQFAPHLLAVPVGSTVSFPNFDPIFHNVFSLSPVRAFDLGVYKDGETREITFDKEGFLRVACNLHANMSAYLVVVKAPHYAVTDTGGRFRFRSLAPGKDRVKAWSETSSEPLTQVVTINSGENNLTLDVPARAKADLGTDKFGITRGKAP
jgi:hemoglobin